MPYYRARQGQTASIDIKDKKEYINFMISISYSLPIKQKEVCNVTLLIVHPPGALLKTNIVFKYQIDILHYIFCQFIR